MLDEPFRGVDIGARRRIGDAARARAEEGAAVVVLVSGRIALDTPAGVHDRARIVNALLDDPGHPKETA